KLEGVFGNTHYGPDWEQEWRKKCRICSKVIFPRFFSFSVPSDDLSRAEMETILNSLPDKERFCKCLKYLIKQKHSDGSTKLSVFLERMEDYTSKIPQDHIPIIIETFFDMGDELIIPEDDFFISWGNDIRMGRMIWQLLRRYNDKNKRFEILKNAFEKGQAISMMVNELISFWKQRGKYGGTKESDEDILLDEDHLETLQGIVLDKIKEAVKEGRLLNAPFLPSVLHYWEEWGNKGEVRDWINRVVSSDEKLPIFLSKFLQKTSSETITDRVAQIHWRLNPNWLKDFIDVDILEKRCNEVLSNDSIVATLNDKQKLAIAQFLEEKHLLDKGKNPDDPFFYIGVGER
ncbi:NTPase, partial [Methanosarcinales archaeon]